jgi:predicted MFS family arabinose efflux permease
VPEGIPPHEKIRFARGEIRCLDSLPSARVAHTGRPRHGRLSRLVAVAVLAIAVVLWGVAFNMVPVATQLWMTRVEPERTESALALQVTSFQVAIMLGAASGGALLDRYGVSAALLAGAVAAVAAGLVFAALRAPRG